MHTDAERGAGPQVQISIEGGKPASKLSGGMIAFIFLAVLVVLIAANML